MADNFPRPRIRCSGLFPLGNYVIMNKMTYFLIFISGLIVGSFLNSVIYRLGKESFLRGRSYCPHCGHRLKAEDLVPVLSYLFLRGKCRYCGHEISSHYPLVELSTGALFVSVTHLSLMKFASHPFYFRLSATGFWLLVASLLLVILVYDLKHYIIPDSVLAVLLALTALWYFWGLLGGFYGGFELLLRLASGMGAALPFLLIVLISHGKWMGMGDVKLIFLMGLLLGWPEVMVGLFSAFVIGGIMGLVLMVLNKKKMESKMAFGPLLITGTFIAWGWGPSILNWYLSYLYL